MSSTTLQIQLPAEPLLTPEQLKAITGRAMRTSQMAWLDEHGWRYELAADGTLLVGSLYANLRLAGLEPASAGVAGAATGFDLAKTR